MNPVFACFTAYFQIHNVLFGDHLAIFAGPTEEDPLVGDDDLVAQCNLWTLCVQRPSISATNIQIRVPRPMGYTFGTTEYHFSTDMQRHICTFLYFQDAAALACTARGGNSGMREFFQRFGRPPIDPSRAANLL